MTEAEHLSDIDIQSLLDEALEPAAARRARQHIADCEGCARRLEAQAHLFAAIESWGVTSPDHDLTPVIVERLAHRRTPVGLRVATAVEAGLALLITLLAWPLVGALFTSLQLPTIPGLELGATEELAAQVDAWFAAGEAALQQVSVSIDAWLRLAPQWMALWPAIVAGALLLAVLGNSILLAGETGGRSGIRPRRL
jgi:hypothetical protein